MVHKKNTLRMFLAAAAVVAVACTDSPAPSEPGGGSPSYSRSSTAQDRLAALFPDVSAEILAAPGTVYADHDEARGKLVFGVENANSIPGITRSLVARGLSAEEFVVQVTEPIVQLASLQTAILRPTQAGTQIHFGNYVCTMGFNVSHSGGRSFITNSHCTNVQGGVEGTTYAQPSRSVSGTIATEVADPTYTTVGCSAGKVCRYSDASRALYDA